MNSESENASHLPGWKTALCISLLYLLFFPAYWGLYSMDPAWHFNWFQGEDKIIEWITFAGFLAGGIIILRILRYRPALPFWTKWFFLGLGIFFIVCAGEEISWGQRLLGFETPESLLEINTQDEFNVHNIEFEHFHPKDVVSWALKLWGLFIPLGLIFFPRAAPWLRSILSPAAMIPCYAIPEIMNLLEDKLAVFYGSRFGQAAETMVHTQLEEWMEMYWGIGVFLSAAAISELWRFRAEKLNPQQPAKQAEKQHKQ